jgi:hypothetical protein
MDGFGDRPVHVLAARRVSGRTGFLIWSKI